MTRVSPNVRYRHMRPEPERRRQRAGPGSFMAFGVETESPECSFEHQVQLLS